MKKKTENLLLTALSVGAAGAAYCSDNKVVKIIASSVALVSCGLLIVRAGKDHLLETIKEVNQECDETEDFVEKSGVDPKDLDSDYLSNHDDPYKENSGKILFRAARNGVLDDDMMSSCTLSESTLHVFQTDRKVVFAIQLPKSQKRGELQGRNVYLYFKEEIKDYAAMKEIGIKSGINFYQRGMARVWVNNKLHFEPIEKLEGEETREYVKRINSILETWDEVEDYRRERIEEFESRGKILKGYDNFMFIEFPVKLEGNDLPGMTLTKTMWLIDELMSTYFEINVGDQGMTKKFEFNHIMFHPGDNFGELYAWNDEDKVIELTSL